MRSLTYSAVFALLSLVSTSLAQQVVMPPPTIGGGGTANYIPLWTSGTTLGNSNIYQSGTNLGIGTTTPGSSLDVAGNINVGSANSYRIGQSPVVSISGTGNLFLGAEAGGSNTSGYDNVFSGSGSGYNNSTGSYNTFSGFQAGYFNTTGGGNTFNGFAAGLNNTTGGQNSFFGLKAGLSNTSGCCNTFIGYTAGFRNQSGFGNTFIGYATGNQSTGDYNTFSGSDAGYFNTTGSNNVFSGFYAGAGNTAGGANVYIGFEAGLSNNGTDNIYLGDAAGYGITDENNTMRLGYPSSISSTYVAGIYGVNISGVAVQINSKGQLGVVGSSRRYKEQIQDMNDRSSQFMRLRPVTFLFRPEYSEGPRKLQYGLIAEEVAEVYPELVAYGIDGQPYSVRYQLLIPILLNEAQKQYRRAEAQAAVITMQDNKIEQLEKRLSQIEALIGTQVRTAEDRSRTTLGGRASQ